MFYVQDTQLYCLQIYRLGPALCPILRPPRLCRAAAHNVHRDLGLAAVHCPVPALLQLPLRLLDEGRVLGIARPLQPLPHLRQ